MSETIATAPAQETPASAPQAIPGEAKKETDPTSQDSFSKRFSALNRERKEIDKSKDQVKRERAAFEAEMAKFKAEKEEVESYKKKREEIKSKKDPIAALQEFGYTYEEAAQFMLNDQKPTAELMVKSLEEKLALIQSQLEEKDKKALEAEKRLLEQQSGEQNKEAINAIKVHLESSPKFDALVALGMHEKIFEEINKHYNETEEVLEIDEVASKMIEGVKQALDAVTKTNFYKDHYGSKDTTPPKSPPKTLSNQLSSQTVSSQDKKPIKSDEERLKNALALLSK